VIGLVGQDAAGRQLRELLTNQQIDTAGVIDDPAFRTIVKTRIIARHQQVVRVDREQIGALTDENTKHAIDRSRQILDGADAIIFEDYGKGFLGEELVRRVCGDARSAGKIVTADPNPRHPIYWQNVTAVKPNRTEAFDAAGLPWRDPSDDPMSDDALLQAGQRLIEKWDTRIVLVTLGEHGMMLFERGELPHHIPTKARQVFDVSGAGDTAIALFTLSLCCDATPAEAAEVANHASAVVVGKLGTATATREELVASFAHDDGGI
jgi:D-beta-D-heptose 7-phosphate kinase/D-beta-D-heptose 1-phosphate adenosyltransferase